MLNLTKSVATVLKLCGFGLVVLTIVGCNSEGVVRPLTDIEPVPAVPAKVAIEASVMPALTATSGSQDVAPPLKQSRSTPILEERAVTPPPTLTGAGGGGPSVGISVEIITLSPSPVEPGDSIQLEVHFIGPQAFIRPEVRYQGIAEPQVLWLQGNEFPGLFTWTWMVPEEASEGEATVVVKAAVAYTSDYDFRHILLDYDHLPNLDEEWHYSDSAVFQVVESPSSLDMTGAIVIPTALNSFDWHSTPTIEVEVDTKTPSKPTIGEFVIIAAIFVGPPAFVKAEIQYPGIREPKLLPSQLIIMEQRLENMEPRLYWRWKVPAEVPEGEVTVMVRAALVNTLTDDFGGQWIDFENLPAEDDWKYSDSVTFMVIKK